MKKMLVCLGILMATAPALAALECGPNQTEGILLIQTATLSCSSGLFAEIEIPGTGGDSRCIVNTSGKGLEADSAYDACWSSTGDDGLVIDIHQAEIYTN